MTLNILAKGDAFQFEKALAAMNWDVDQFERELEIYAKTQPPAMQERVRKAYNKFLKGCGAPWKIVVEGECEGVKVRTPKVKRKPKPPVTPQTESKTDSAETVQIEKPKEESTIPEPISTPAPETAGEPKTETPIEQPQEQPQTTPTEPKTKTKNTTAQFTYGNANEFRDLIKAMCVLTNEITWKLTPEGLSMRQMDPSRVAMVDLEIKKTEFEEYVVKTPGLVTFSGETIYKAVFAKRFDKGTAIGVKIDGAAMKIIFVVRDSRIRERSYPTLEAEQENIPTPKVTFNAKYKVIAKQFASDLSEMDKVSDHITMVADPESLRIVANGDYGSGETKYQRGDENLIEIEVRENSKACYSLTYLSKIVVPSLCELAVIEFSTEMPIKVTNKAKFGDLVYYVAPRIATE